MQATRPIPSQNRLTFDEEINVAMAVAGKRAGAEKHDDADDEQAEHGAKTRYRRSYDA